MWRSPVACLLVLTWLFGAAQASGNTCKTSEPQVAPQTFPSVLSALKFISQKYSERWRATDTEYVGTLYRTPAGFLISVAHGCPSTDSFRYPVRSLAGAETIALWHSHGAPGPARDWFSADDIALVRQLDLPFYLFAPTGELKVLRPGAIGRVRSVPGRRPSHRLGRGVAGELVAAVGHR